MRNRTNWPLLGVFRVDIRWLLTGYLVCSQAVNLALFFLLVAVSPVRTLTPPALVFVIWISASMFNTTMGTVVAVLVGEHLQGEALNLLHPEPTKVVIETRQGETLGGH